MVFKESKGQFEQSTFFTARSLVVLHGFPLARSNTERSRSLSLCSLSLTVTKTARTKHMLVFKHHSAGFVTNFLINLA